MKYGSMMSTFSAWNVAEARRCEMLRSAPVSRLPTQMTRCPRASSSSQRCEPRKPAPPVTTQVAMRRRAFDADVAPALLAHGGPAQHVPVAAPQGHARAVEVLEQRLGVPPGGAELVAQSGDRPPPLGAAGGQDGGPDLVEGLGMEVQRGPDAHGAPGGAQLRQRAGGELGVGGGSGPGRAQVGL